MARYTIQPLTPERWSDFETLFGPRGACGGCWCMTPRLTSAEYEQSKGAGNKRKFKRIVNSGAEPGVLAYAGAEPVGWCAVAPREEFGRLARSRILQPVDEQPVWSIVCLFIHKDHRRCGLSRKLIDGAVKHARAHGARIVEAYPVEPQNNPMPDVFAFTGVASAFRKTRFREVARRSKTRPIMRRFLRQPSSARAAVVKDRLG